MLQLVRATVKFLPSHGTPSQSTRAESGRQQDQTALVTAGLPMAGNRTSYYLENEATKSYLDTKCVRS